MDKKPDTEGTLTPDIDCYFVRNTTGISSVELFWGLGLPVVMESTFLQIFLHSLGANSFLIGLIPTVFFAGVSIFSLLSSFLTAHLAKKKSAVIIFHLFASLPILFFGIFLKISGLAHGTITIFFVSYGFFSIGIGLVIPTWQNYLVSIYSDKKILQGHSIMWISQSIGRFLSGFVILKIISRYSFSTEGAGIIFSLVGLVFILGSLMFLLTKESAQVKNYNEVLPLKVKLHSFKKDIHRAVHNRNFLLFLASDFEQYAVISILSFYANYAVEFCRIQPQIAAGAFVILIYTGSIMINILFGQLSRFGLKAKYMSAKIVSLLAVIMLYFSHTLWAFFAVSFLFGISRGARSLIYSPSIKKIAGQRDATNFFGIAPLLVMPLSTGLPLLTGAFLDHFSAFGADSYRFMFAGMSILIVLGIIFLSRTRIEEKSPLSSSTR